LAIIIQIQNHVTTEYRGIFSRYLPWSKNQWYRATLLGSFNRRARDANVGRYVGPWRFSATGSADRSYGL